MSEYNNDDIKIMLGELRGDLRGMSSKIDTLLKQQSHYELRSAEQREHLRTRIDAVENSLAGLRTEVDHITSDMLGFQPFVKSHRDAVSFRRGALWVLGGLITIVTAAVTMILTFAKPAIDGFVKLFTSGGAG